MEKREWGLLVLSAILIFACSLIIPAVQAHETYVLSQAEITRIQNIHTHANPFVSLLDPYQFYIFLVVIALLVLLLVTSTVLSRHDWAKKLTKVFTDYSSYAVKVLRVVFGFNMIVAGLYQTLFLPDLVLGSPILAYAQIAVGFLLIFDFATDVFALVSILLYLYGFVIFGWAMFDHIDILGIALFLWFSHHGRTPWLPKHIIIKDKLKNHGFELLRISFGLSILILGLTKKFLVPEYFLRVVDTFSISALLHFEPLFIVFLAGFLEIIIGLILISGIQTRVFTVVAVLLFTAEGYLMQEMSVGHLVIYSILIFIMLYKGNKKETWTLENRWEKIVRI